MATSSSAVAVDPSQLKYDVFINFRGETRNSFTSHLYSALRQKQTNSCIDEVGLEKEDTISPALLKGIEKSEISIIIFSKNYASSSWCLDELVQILKCKKEKARIVLPVFFGIDPSHIRKQKRSYAEAFVGHEERFEMEKVQKLRQALKDAAAMPGWDSQNTSESEIVDGEIHMNDLIQEMDRDIVLRSNQKLGKRSRLWINKDVSFVLENNKGTEAIEGIYLPWIEELHLRPDVFEDMHRLRLLKIHAFHCKVYVNGALKYLLDWLTYIDWEDYPGESLPLYFNTRYLVELHMPRSNLRQLWDGIQECGSLKLINLQFSEHLTKIPDLSLAPKLESINLSHCRSLIHIPSFNIQAPSYESALRPFGTERTPGYVSFRGCRRLKILPKVSGNITVLILFGSLLKELPLSIEFLENLVHLDLRYCRRLKSLPTLPRNIEKLHLEYSGIEQIPSSSIECLCSLRELSLNNCKSLESLPSIIWKLKTLEELDLSGCQKLRKLPEISNQSEHLCRLFLSDTSIQELPSSIENLIGLRRLSLRRCKHLEFIPETLCELTRLQKLCLPGCSRLETLPSNIWKLKALEEIDLSECSKLRNLPEISNHLEHLWKLNLARTSIQELPSSIENLIGLCDLSLEWCKHLQLIPSSIGNLYRLKLLNISYCENLQSLPELPLFIEYLNARQCSSLELVSTSRSTHKLEHWRDKYDISFVNCSKLGENAISTIFKEFLYKVFCSATTPREVVTSKGMKPQVVGCYSRHEIPKWFNNQCEGSSTTIRLPSNWYSPETFLGFVVSVVIADKDIDEEADSIVECELHLMAKKHRFRVDVFKYTVTSRLDHTLMWYNYFDHSKANFEKYPDASLEFKSHFKVKWCGVRILYLKDANLESWRNDCDTDYDTSDDDCGSDEDD